MADRLPEKMDSLPQGNQGDFVGNGCEVRSGKERQK